MIKFQHRLIFIFIIFFVFNIQSTSARNITNDILKIESIPFALKLRLSSIYRYPFVASRVSGVISDEEGNPLVGVSVHVKGTNKGTISDEKGHYDIEVTNGSTLIFSYIGYQTQKITVHGESVLNIILKVSSSGLNEVIVVGYGKTTKRKINSAVSTLDMKDVAPIPVQSINDAVAGRIPGVFVATTSGAPGVKSQISIRGGGTPLFVIDNVIRSEQDFENLNPNDIATYSVLKDAAATSLYGAQGGNGVVLVTTKKGREGKVSIDYSFNQIFSQPTILPKKMAAFDHYAALNKVYVAENKPQATPDSILNTYKDFNIDMQKIAFRNFAPEQRHDLSLSVGGKHLTYYGSLSYYNQGSILRTDRNYNKRVTYRMNTVSDFQKIGLEVITGIDGYVETNSVPNSSTASNFSALFSHVENAIVTEPLYNIYGLPRVGGPIIELSDLSGYIKTQTRAFNGYLALDWATPVKGLHFKVKGNYNIHNAKDKSWDRTAPTYPDSSTIPITKNLPNLKEDMSDAGAFLLQGFITYNHTFGNHHLDFTGGYEQSQSRENSISAERRQFTVLYDQFFIGPTLNQLANGEESESARASFIGRLTYNYKSKYFLDATMRYDGSDLFPRGKRWGAFYAFSGGWILSEEGFMQSLKKNNVLDYLKLRGSYGLTGTVAGISRFAYVPGYTIKPNAYVIGGVPVQGSSEGAPPSTDYSWYSIENRNLGADFTTLNNHLSGSIDYFYMRTSGYVQPDTRYAAVLGQSLPKINSDAARRREGFEFNLTWRGEVKGFTYQVGFNFSHYNQLWEKYPGEDETSQKDPYTRKSNTDDSYLTTGYINLGYYGDNDDLLAGPRSITSLNVVAGDLKYEDVNGDGKIDENDQRRVGSSTFPHVNYGFTMDLAYKGFYLNAVIMGSGNRDRYLGQAIRGSSGQGILKYEFQTDYWTPENRNAQFPRPVTSTSVNGNNNFLENDFWILKSRYVRLKYLQFGYDLKSVVLKQTPFSHFKIFISGQNLLTSSKSLKYFIDPETDPNNTNYPIQRTISLGINVGF